VIDTLIDTEEAESTERISHRDTETRDTENLNVSQAHLPSANSLEVTSMCEAFPLRALYPLCPSR